LYQRYQLPVEQHKEQMPEVSTSDKMRRSWLHRLYQRYQLLVEQHKEQMPEDSTPNKTNIIAPENASTNAPEGGTAGRKNTRRRIQNIKTRLLA
jgi:hypothetical protein